MARSYDLPEPDWFTTGTIGPPGRRVFFLQASGDGALVSLRCEKQQVGALAEYLAGILDDLPEVDDEEVPPEGELFEPVVPEWTVGSLSVAWDESADRVVLVAEELLSDDDEDRGVDAASVRLRITRAQAAAFVERARGLVAAGRPPCPLCGGPLDPEGHVCPRSNGHHRR
jgi:uncharacterized repeat protein (TIGR03847 family)